MQMRGRERERESGVGPIPGVWTHFFCTCPKINKQLLNNKYRQERQQGLRPQYHKI